MLLLIITKIKRKERIDVFETKYIIQEKMKRLSKLVRRVLVVTMCFSMTGIYSYANEREEIVKPDSLAHYRMDNRTIEITEGKASDDAITPKIFLGYAYIIGTAFRGNMGIVDTYSYIWGTTVSFVQGASASYTLTVSRHTTKSSTWSVGGSVEFPVRIVEAEIKGSYQSSDTATIYAGQTWSADFSEPGTYDLSWYMRAHKYPVYGKAKIMSTGSDHGHITTVYLGEVTFPTAEAAFHIQKR